MNAHDLTRRLIWHGILLFFLGLCVGMFVQSTRNPRMALSAHVGSVMSGMFLAILGAPCGTTSVSRARRRSQRSGWRSTGCT